MSVPAKVVKALLKGDRKVSIGFVSVRPEDGDVIAYNDNMLEVIASEKADDMYFVYGYLIDFSEIIPQ
jgi:hypothetical protein